MFEGCKNQLNLQLRINREQFRDMSMLKYFSTIIILFHLTIMVKHVKHLQCISTVQNLCMAFEETYEENNIGEKFHIAL